MSNVRLTKWFLTILVTVMLIACGGGGTDNTTNQDDMVIVFVDGEHEYEPWITDGTEAGTNMLKDINLKSSGARYTNFTKVGGNIYFIENFAMFSALWKTDGTEAGTVLVRKIPEGVLELIESGGLLYFTLKHNNMIVELWISDGTEAGTKSIKVIQSDNRPEISAMASMGGKLYFLITDYLYDIELWESSGTEATTTLVKDIWSGHDAGGAYNNSLSVINGKLYFTGYTDTSGREPWVSDGTAVGTTILKDIYAGVESSDPSSFVELSGDVYFISNGGNGENEVWTTDGTAGATVVYGEADTNPESIVWFDGQLHYSSYDRRVYKTDGTGPGTSAVTDALLSTPRSLLAVAGVGIYFKVDKELWLTDSTSGAGSETKLLDEIGSDMVAKGAKLYFSSADVTNGTELWESDGTVVGSKLLKDISDGNASSKPQNITTVDGDLYFYSDDGTHGLEVWKSDGTADGTTMLKDIVTATASSMFFMDSKSIKVGDTHYFIASNNSNGYNQFWKSDGTQGGTTIIKEINDTFDTYSSLTDLNGTIYFTAYSFAGSSKKVYISDGTELNTKEIADVYGTSFTRSGDTDYFVADRKELWRTDGTIAGTTEIRAGIEMCSNEITKLVNFDNKVYFAGDDGGGLGCELYESNGTHDGTIIVKDIVVGAGDSEPKQFTVVDDKMYFVTEDGTDHILWVTDGTSANVTKVKTIALYHIYALTKSDDKLYFSSNDELWITDGTVAGTVQIKDINPGVYTYTLSGHVVIDDKLYFTANDGTHGRELWVSDGTTDGTNMVLETQDDDYAGFPFVYGELNGKLLFHTIDADVSKLWISDGTSAGTTAIAEKSVSRYAE